MRAIEPTFGIQAGKLRRMNTQNCDDETPETVLSGEAHERATGRAGLRPLRAVGRPDNLTAQKVDVAIILQAMLGTVGAAEYLADNAVDMAVSLRVLTQPQLRRGRHDHSGIPH